MSKIARKLVLSIVTVVLTVFALGTTTFAWFTLTNTSVIQPFQAQIVADTGIEIAIGNPTGDPIGMNWVTTLTTSQVNTYIETAYAGAFRFNHVTTADGSNFYTLGASAMVPALATMYLEIPLHFRSNSATQIQWSSVSLSSPVATWINDVTFTHVDGTTYTANQPISIDASNSMRAAILGNVGGLSTIVAYEKPAAGSNIVLGIGGDFRGAQELLDLGDGPQLYYVGANGSYNYYFRKNATLPFGTDAVVTLATITTLANNPVLDMTSGNALTAGADYYGSVILRIWLEGWDANAFNAVLDRIITASFQFTGV